MITIHHYAGITGKNIDAVTEELTATLWEYCGVDGVDYQTVHCFSRGNTDIFIFTNDDGICGKVEEEYIGR